MPKGWDFYFTQIDGAPAAILLDLRLARDAPLRGYAHVGFVRIPMLQPGENGLQSEAETAALDEIEDALAHGLAAANEDIYVGRSTSAGMRDLYFYVREAEPFEASVRAIMAEFPQYRRRLGVLEDPDWSTYFDLCPDEDALREMAARRPPAA